MSHLISAPALDAAGNILKKYDITVRPPEELPSGRVDKLEANERCAAILIDYATNVFEVSKLRPELRYWQERLFAGTATAPQLGGYLQRLIDAFGKVPKRGAQEAPVMITIASPAEFRARPEVLELSKAATEAARFLYHYYRVTPKSGMPDEALDRVRVAKIAESSLGLSRALRMLPVIVSIKENLRAGKATVDDVKRALRKTGILFEFLPGFECRDEEQKILQ